MASSLGQSRWVMQKRVPKKSLSTLCDEFGRGLFEVRHDMLADERYTSTVSFLCEYLGL